MGGINDKRRLSAQQFKPGGPGNPPEPLLNRPSGQLKARPSEFIESRKGGDGVFHLVATQERQVKQKFCVGEAFGFSGSGFFFSKHLNLLRT